MDESIVVSSPGRADFLNTHQDYKGLPVVPVGINLRLFLFAKPSENNTFIIHSLDIEKHNEPSTDSFQIKKNEMLERKFFGNYFRGIVNVLVKRRLAERLHGLQIMVKSEIPIGSGLASSAAVEVAFSELLNHCFNLSCTKRDLAEIAFEAENQELGIPCGRLDQYGVAYGGIIKIDCRPPFKVESLPFRDLTFAIVDSGIRHSTGDIHPKRQNEINSGLEILMKSRGVSDALKAKLGYKFNEPKWNEIDEMEIAKSLSILEEKSKQRILFTLRMQRLTEYALKILRFERVNDEDLLTNLGDEALKLTKVFSIKERSHRILGKIMNEQHSLLRDFYDISLLQIEKLCSSALEAGAYGAKISGAGMGGSIIALVKNEKEGRKVVDACLSAGAKNGWVSGIGEGVKIEMP